MICPESAIRPRKSSSPTEKAQKSNDRSGVICHLTQYTCIITCIWGYRAIRPDV